MAASFVPVAGEDLAAAEQQLAVLGDPHLGAGEGLADGADLQRVGAVDGERGGGLGEPVALEHGQPDAAVEVAEPVAERGAAGHGVRAAAAERGAQPPVDQPGEDARAGRGRASGTLPAVERPGVGDRGLGGAVEDAAAALGGGALGGGVEHLLEDPGHGEHERRLELGEVGEQVLDVGAVAEPDPGLAPRRPG